MAAVNITQLSGGTILTVAMAGGVVDPTLYATVQALAAQMAAAMPWIAYDPVGVMTLAMDQGSYPYPIQNPSSASLPAWMNDPNRISSWQQMAAGWAPQTNAVIQGQIAQAVSAGQVLANNVAFWNAVAKYSGVDAIMAAWDQLWQSLASFKAQRDATAAAIAIANGVLQNPAYSGRAPAVYAQANASAAQQLASLSSQVASVIAPLGAAGRTAAGLGVAPLVIAGIAAVTIAAISATVYGIVAKLAAVQQQANANAQALVTWRDQADQTDFETGKITNEQLVQRRAQTVDAADTLVNAESAAKVGGALSALGSGALKAGLGIAAAGAALVGLILVIRRLRSR